ncbi:MAG: CCA tRNA nucleotidyltransferase [Pseudomonadota bacterium]
MVIATLGGDSLLVGGCVRNAVIEREATDVDIATKHRPEFVIQKLEASGIKAIPTGIDHGTVTAVINKKPFEITTLRKDVETDGRRAVVEFSVDWLEDAKRRDFTMNTLLMDLNGNVFDPTRKGFEDLEANHVVFVGDAEQRIREDYLRILRFFRFHAWFGQGEMDQEALSACGKLANKIGELSKERITQEVLKLLSASQPILVLKTLFENNILPELFHVKHDLKILGRYYDFAHVDPMSSLVILSAFDVKHLSVLETRMTFSNAQKKQFESLCASLDGFDLSHKSIKRMIYKTDNDFTAQLAYLFAAKDWQELTAETCDILENWEAPKFPMTGEDLIKQGHKPGPELGKKLKQLEREWLEQELSR